MSDQVELTNPIDHSVGGINGHLFRRGFHLSMTIIPWVYFEYAEKISEYVNLYPSQLVSALIISLIVVESARLKFKITIFGQRDYESEQVSALAWGAFAIAITFLLLPNSPDLVYPLIWSLSLGDPFLGEMRRKGFEARTVFYSGSVFISIIWLCCFFLYSTPLWLIPIFAPLCVAAEWPRLRWIDDNATMLLIPLAGILIAIPWI
ncbi:MAG: hypothetical protein QGI21_01495 [Candidatus Poseidoniaceae archaeon]|jgi:hypothetical protein|nr:hypothetical protein [Candidatus Poseidoniaceae archaeon]